MNIILLTTLIFIQHLTSNPHLNHHVGVTNVGFVDTPIDNHFEKFVGHEKGRLLHCACTGRVAAAALVAWLQSVVAGDLRQVAWSRETCGNYVGCLVAKRGRWSLAATTLVAWSQ